MRTILCGTSALALLLCGPALAQSDRPKMQSEQRAAEDRAGGNSVVVLDEWSNEPLYTSGWSVERLLDETEVVDPNGEDIGEVENVIFSDDGRVLSVVAELGGFLDIGDTHVSIPWKEAKLSQNTEDLTVPITEETVDNYPILGDIDLFDDRSETIEQRETKTVKKVDDDLRTGATAFKASDLVGSYAYLSGDERYGYVDDLIVQDGRVSAVVVDASMAERPGYFAYPYDGYGVAPNRYNLQYSRDEVAVIEPFDYDRMRRGTPEEGEARGAGN